VTVDITVLIAVLGFALSVGTFFIGRMTAVKTSGQKDGEMQANVRHIKDTVDKQSGKLDQVVENYEEIKIELERLKGRMTALEQKVNMLHGGDGA
jgi:gas vesicle protein